jgi:hypothetical protein
MKDIVGEGSHKCKGCGHVFPFRTCFEELTGLKACTIYAQIFLGYYLCYGWLKKLHQRLVLSLLSGLNDVCNMTYFSVY